MKLLRSLSVALALLLPAQAQGPTPAAQPGVRGLWVDGFGPGLKTPAQVSQLVADAQAMHVNAIFAQTIRRGDCFCRKASVPVISDPDLAPGYDPLADLTAKAHSAGLKVIAWVAVSGAWNSAVPNRDPAHLTRLHGLGASPAQDWLSHQANGNSAVGSDLFLDLANPEVADFVTREVLSVIQNYPVDGIQLDRIRYPDGGGWGYNPTTLARYRAETGFKGTPAPQDAAWNAWKREQVTNLVRRLFLEVKRVRPELWMSAATIAYGPGPADQDAFRKSRTYAEVLQDWPGWMDAGLLDLNVLMNYKTEDKGDQGLWYDGWNAFASAQAAQSGRLAASGSALYLNTPEASLSQAQRALSAGLGWVGYAYRTPSLDAYRGTLDTGAARARLLALLNGPQGPLAANLPFPDAPPSVRALLGRVVGTPVPGGQRAELYQAGQLIARVTTDGNGYFGFTRLPPGPLEVRVGGQRWQETPRDGQVLRLPDFLLREVSPVVAGQ